ncbi:MAG: glutamate synthase subunit beta [Myxococcaceae bacterium]
MGKPTGFIEYGREGPHRRPVLERTRDFKEVTLPFSADESKRQAARCMDCGVPFCHQGCPLGNVIPDFNEHVYKGRWREAYDVLASTNDFPEFTGRLCPAPCEGACVLAIDQDAVTIEELEKEIIERAWHEGWVQPRVPTFRTGRRVAVVGSGPAGLAAASQLNRAGHFVTVFERDPKPGGLLRYGIPDFKMEKWVIARRLKILEAEGVHFSCGVNVGREPTWSALREQFDAVAITIGARKARALELEGAQLSGVLQAMDYLDAQNRAIAAGTDSPLSARGKRVVILGGGDTGSDCVGTAHRQGAACVTQVELMPMPPSARAKNNPWPSWPVVFRTSSSQEEGGARLYGRRTLKLEGESGQLRAMHWIGVELKDGKLTDVPGTEERFETDLLVQAMGFTGPETAQLTQQLRVKLDPRGNLLIDGSFQTSVPGVFAAGDASRGASLIVWAIADGRELARSVDARLAQR